MTTLDSGYEMKTTVVHCVANRCKVALREPTLDASLVVFAALLLWYSCLCPQICTNLVDLVLQSSFCFEHIDTICGQRMSSSWYFSWVPVGMPLHIMLFQGQWFCGHVEGSCRYGIDCFLHTITVRNYSWLCVDRKNTALQQLTSFLVHDCTRMMGSWKLQQLSNATGEHIRIFFSSVH